MVRKKVENALKTERQVDDALRQIGELEIQIERIELTGNEQINEVRMQMEDQSAALINRLQVIKAQVKLWAEEAYKDEEFGKTRTKKMQFGYVSYRRSQKVATVSGVKIAQAVELLKNKGMAICVRIKEELDKEKIRALKLSEESLKAVGLRMAKDDTFGYGIYREKIVVPKDAGMEEETVAKSA